ncbi:MAG TPA: glucose 1-dehydrogenase [Nitrososphaerales archaeon]|nr:glucose 1-dehydrogenase [Nitrososphaerales archaeon]
MKAIVVTPMRSGSLRIEDVPEPVPGVNQVLLEVLRVGVCGTDRDIIAGFYGQAPKGSDSLTLGHESLCRVAEPGEAADSLERGQLVVPTVRRPCPEGCLNCRSGESDFCLTGHYSEHGIKLLDGFASQFAVSDSSFVVKMPDESLSDVGVLLEPLTVVEKGLIQTFLIQNSRMKWKPQRALVLGAGPVGLLATATLILNGLMVDTVATRSEDSLKAKLVMQTGANYINAKQTDLETLDSKYDIVFEITGSPSIALEAQQFIGVNGVVCYLGIYREKQETEDAGRLFTDMVLGNKIHFGSVNANRSYFEKGAKDLSDIRKKWPGFLEKMITRIASPDDPLAAYDLESEEEIKSVIEFV